MEPLPGLSVRGLRPLTFAGRFSTSVCRCFSQISAWPVTLESVKILVVDDEPAVRDSLERALRLEGYQTDLAADGAQALAALAGDGTDAVVLDVMMPHIDGLEVCRRMRSMGDRTPVLMLTA